jgi:hypothetical protein
LKEAIPSRLPWHFNCFLMSMWKIAALLFCFIANAFADGNATAIKCPGENCKKDQEVKIECVVLAASNMQGFGTTYQSSGLKVSGDSNDLTIRFKDSDFQRLKFIFKPRQYQSVKDTLKLAGTISEADFERAACTNISLLEVYGERLHF